MPTYEYRCKSCGEGLEVVQSFTDDPLTDCPVCGGPLRKVFGSIGITFKGSGFYKTDSRAGSSSSSSSDARTKEGASADRAKADAKSGASTEGGSSGSKESASSSSSRGSSGGSSSGSSTSAA